MEISIDCKLALENFAVDHSDKRGAEVVTHLNELAALNLLVVFHRLLLLRL